MAIFWPILIYHTLQRALCYKDTVSMVCQLYWKQKSSQIWQKTVIIVLRICVICLYMNTYITHSIIFFYIVVSLWESVFNAINILYEQTLKITLRSIKTMNLTHEKRFAKSFILWALNSQKGWGWRGELCSLWFSQFANLDVTDVILLPQSMSLFLGHAPAMPTCPAVAAGTGWCGNQGPTCTRLRERGMKLSWK